MRLETFSDGVFAIAVTLLAVQLRPPNLDGVTTVGGLLRGHPGVVYLLAARLLVHGWQVRYRRRL